MIINIVSCPEHSVLESIDDLLLLSDEILTLANNHLNLFLSSSKILNHESQVSILLIVLLEFLIHGLGALSQVNDFHLSWSNVLIEILDL